MAARIGLSHSFAKQVAVCGVLLEANATLL